MKHTPRLLVALLTPLAISAPLYAAEPGVGAAAPGFELQTDQGAPFKLEARKGQWTVLYFYPKDDTPGCTQQACAFRDAIAAIRKLGAEVYGISTDSVDSHKRFIAKHKLNFPLLSDSGGKVAKQYGADGVFGFSKRWTFIVDPGLTIQWMKKGVDPAVNAGEVATELARLQQRK